jgi:hypothetical protein
MQQQDAQKRPRLVGRGRQRAPFVHDFERTKDPELHKPRGDTTRSLPGFAEAQSGSPTLRRMSRNRTTAMVMGAALALAPAAPAGGQQRAPEGGRTVEVRVIEHDEFRWGDAGIGALAGAGLVAVCGGLFIASERKRRPMS